MRGITDSRWLGYAVALAGVAFLSVLIGLVERQLHIANISMLYLIAVLATASAWGRGSAVLASVAAFLTFNWFFVEPRYTLTVADPEQWIALLLFLTTAIITGQLAAGQRRRALEAQQREREAVVLYDVVRLMSEPGLGHALQAVAERMRAELGVAAVAIHLDDQSGAPIHVAVGEADALRLAEQRGVVPGRLLHQGPAPTGARRGGPGRWVRIVPRHVPGVERWLARDQLHLVPVSAGARRMGALLVVRGPGAPRFSATASRLLSAVAAQLGLALERARLRREATEAEVLRLTDELKSALLNAVSHDLRTPLASIIASAGSLRQRDVAWTEQDREEFAEAIEHEAQRLNRIVGNLLDLSRIEAGSLRPDRGWYDVSALVDDTLGRLRPTTAQHKIVVDISEELPPVPLAYVQIDQVLSNLIENATKYTAPGTEIRVAARRADGQVEMEVADQGRGVPQAALVCIFDAFYRVNGEEPRPRGTGVGLAVAKGLVEAHGGRIWAEAGPEGGARFVFTLPLTVPDRPGAGSANL